MKLFGPPHILIPSGLDKELEQSLFDAFLAMDKSPEGREILLPLGIKRFVPAREEDYTSAIELYQRFVEMGGTSWP